MGIDGITVSDSETGEPACQSKVCAVTGISQVVASRVTMASWHVLLTIHYGANGEESMVPIKTSSSCTIPGGRSGLLPPVHGSICLCHLSSGCGDNLWLFTSKGSSSLQTAGGQVWSKNSTQAVLQQGSVVPQ